MAARSNLVHDQTSRNYLRAAKARFLTTNPHNTIYMSDQAVAGGFMFTSVLDAIQGDGFNPLRQEVQIVFPTGAPFKQFTSDNDILAAKAMGKIMLMPTTQVYRCSVVGPK